jgi:hypothetical protein
MISVFSTDGELARFFIFVYFFSFYNFVCVCEINYITYCLLPMYRESYP